MRWISLAAAMACVATATAAPAQKAQEILSLEPTSDWVIDYADERCSLVRDFGTGKEAVRLRIDSFGSWIYFRMVVSGKPVPGPDGPTGKLILKFTPDAESRDLGSLRGSLGSEPAAFTSIVFAPAEWNLKEEDSEFAGRPEGAILADPRLDAFERQTSTITLDLGGRQLLQLNVREMSRPLKALRDCIDNLRESWGLDPAVERSLTRRPFPQDRMIANLQGKYPGNMLFRRRNGYVPVRIMVDADGNSTQCTVQTGQVERDFSRAVCAELAGTFNPALDSSGNPVSSVYYVSVIFVLR